MNAAGIALITGFDTDSWFTLDAVNRAVDAGCQYAFGYLGAGRNLNAAAVALLSEAGMAIGSFYECGAKRALGGTAAGTEDAAFAYAAAMAIGQPAGSAIFATADFDVIADDEDVVLAYFRALHAGLLSYQLGGYGNGVICTRAKAANIITFDMLAGGDGMRGSRAYRVAGGWTLSQHVGDHLGLNIGISIDSGEASTLDGWSWSLPTTAPAA